MRKFEHLKLFMKLFVKEFKNRKRPSLAVKFVILAYLAIYIGNGALFYRENLISGLCYGLSCVLSIVAGVLLFYPKESDKEEK
ncbi:hypothetical protein ACFX4N_24510 [Priestia sp. YIM B13551]|uniref:hypothetical protein n=1 Tax=Priestia sp. YIM B13551 TaxID=3366306 RepID=UPI00366C5CBE